MGSFDYPPYVPVAAKRAKAEKKIRQLQKKNPNLAPVIIKGRTLARTWWGKSWNANLERYADYSNRIGRGRSYVRNMAVIDLQIGKGKVEALVQGSRSTPYEVTIDIKTLSKSNWEAIATTCTDQLDSLQDLLAGRFPKSLAHLFMQEGSGLFPSPKEIHLECSCPDWANMCKHVAAVLYGIGARLDEDPSLFFKLRQVDMNDLIGKAIQKTSETWLEKAGEAATPTIAEADLGAVFGIDMDAAPEFAGTPPKGAKPAKKKKLEKAARSTKKIPRSKATDKPVDEKQVILDLVNTAKKGITAGELHQQSGIAMVKVRNVLYLAYRKGEIRKVSRGFYGPLAQQRSATLADAILEIIAAHPQGMGAGELARQSGCEQKQARSVLSRLFKSGKIRRMGRGVYVAD